MRQAVIEEALILRKELDKREEEEGGWKCSYLANYKQFLAMQEQESFLIRFIDFQVTSSMQKGARQRRYPEEMLRFWKGFCHQSSGRSCIKYLTGAGNYGKNNSNNNFNLHVPSNRTLDNYEEPGYYGVR